MRHNDSSPLLRRLLERTANGTRPIIVGVRGPPALPHPRHTSTPVVHQMDGCGLQHVLKFKKSPSKNKKTGRLEKNNSGPSPFRSFGIYFNFNSKNASVGSSYNGTHHRPRSSGHQRTPISQKFTVRSITAARALLAAQTPILLPTALGPKQD